MDIVVKIESGSHCLIVHHNVILMQFFTMMLAGRLMQPACYSANSWAIRSSSRNHGSDDHLKRSAHAYVSRDGTIDELIEWMRLPGVTRSIGGVSERQTGTRRVIRLLIQRRHLVDHHIQRRNHVEAKTTSPGLKESISGRTGNMSIRIHLELQAERGVRIEGGGPAQ